MIFFFFSCLALSLYFDHRMGWLYLDEVIIYFNSRGCSKITLMLLQLKTRKKTQEKFMRNTHGSGDTQRAWHVELWWIKRWMAMSIKHGITSIYHSAMERQGYDSLIFLTGKKKILTPISFNHFCFFLLFSRLIL